MTTAWSIPAPLRALRYTPSTVWVAVDACDESLSDVSDGVDGLPCSDASRSGSELSDPELSESELPDAELAEVELSAAGSSAAALSASLLEESADDPSER